MSEQDPIHFTCPHCGKRLKAARKAAGAEARCPDAACGQAIIVPSPVTEPVSRDTGASISGSKTVTESYEDTVRRILVRAWEGKFVQMFGEPVITIVAPGTAISVASWASREGGAGWSCVWADGIERNEEKKHVGTGPKGCGYMMEITAQPALLVWSHMNEGWQRYSKVYYCPTRNP